MESTDLAQNNGNLENDNRHTEMILEEYRAQLPVIKKMETFVAERLRSCFEENHLRIGVIETRIKTEESLRNKLELKGYKYHSINDVTDVLGVRIITFFSDEVDLVSAHVEQLFDIDWENSVDKRKTLEIDRFGYMSLHYICRIPESMYKDPEMPLLNEIRFELQMRSVLQHMWANMYHDMGYKTDVEAPIEYQRNMTRLAGMLELADEQFCQIRKELNDYRRNVQSLVASGNFNEVPLNGDTFRSYLELKPYRRMVEKMAAVNQAEIYEDSLLPYYNVLKNMKMRTIGDLERIRTLYGDGALQLSLFQLASSGSHTIAYSMALQNICVVAILKQGFGEAGLKRLFAALYGEGESSVDRAHAVYEQARKINIV